MKCYNLTCKIPKQESRRQVTKKWSTMNAVKYQKKGKNLLLRNTFENEQVKDLKLLNAYNGEYKNYSQFFFFLTWTVVDSFSV